MQSKKSFIAISSVIHNNKLVSLQTSGSDNISIESGIGFEKAIDFLFSLIKYRKKSGVVFVTYGFTVPLEILFSTMPRYLRDKLFQSHRVTNEINTLATELEQVENVYYSADKLTQEFQLADFERYVLTRSIQENLEVKYKEYKITLRSGKFLTINKTPKGLSAGRSITIYDIYGFFKKKTLRESCNEWLKKEVPCLDKEVFISNALYLDNQTHQLKILAQMECQYIKELSAKLNTELEKIDVNISRFYNPSVISSYFLNKWQAKSNFHNYRRRAQYSPELYKAVTSANVGGRSEQFKLGTIKNVNVYDINSAYAYAACFLPQMLRKPCAVSEWEAEPFSLWYCEFDFTSINPYFGLLPFRASGGGNNVTYPLRGRGYFWQPEVAFVIENYSQCINVKRGFVLDYKPISFAENIGELYNLRLQLKADNNPLEKIIKLSLSSIYGKFAQSLGKQKYYNQFYAGFICSVTRRQLLEATKGYEQHTICFQTDAIHTSADLGLPVTDSLGDFKLSSFDSVTYIDNGVYQASLQAQIQKQKTRGLKDFNFTEALSEISEYNGYNANANVFIGYNLYALNRFGNKAEYLELFNLHKRFYPSRDNTGRIFERRQIDFLNEYLDSSPILQVSDQDSAGFQNANFLQSNMMSGLEVRV